MKAIKSIAVIEPLGKAAATRFKKKYIEKRRQQPMKVVVSTVAGDGTPGFLDGPAFAAKFRSPIDVAVLPNGVIYVADAFNSSIRKIENGFVKTFAGNGNANIINANGNAARFKIPSRITADAEGNLYTLDAADPRIRKISPLADVSTFAGEMTFGFKDGEAGIAQFGQSFGIAADIEGNLFVADSQNDRIRKISASGVVSTIAGNGVPGYISGNGNTSQFRFVTGVIIDKEGNLFVSDITRIRKITPARLVSTFAGGNIKGFIDGKRSIAQFSQIEDMIMDKEGNIYVTDENRIRKITPHGSVSTLAGSSAGYNDGDGDGAKFDGPQGLGMDKAGNIYVADFNNRRIRKISFE
jgi:sugar lactone lactonase YvrE